MMGDDTEALIWNQKYIKCLMNVSPVELVNLNLLI